MDEEQFWQALSTSERIADAVLATAPSDPEPTLYNKLKVAMTAAGQIPLEFTREAQLRGAVQAVFTRASNAETQQLGAAAVEDGILAEFAPREEGPFEPIDLRKMWDETLAEIAFVRGEADMPAHLSDVEA